MCYNYKCKQNYLQVRVGYNLAAVMVMNVIFPLWALCVYRIIPYL